MSRDDTRVEKTDPDALVQILVRCTECGRDQRVGASKAFVAPDPAVLDAGWDGVVLTRIVRCEGCGAEDAYRVDAGDVERLLRRADSRTDAPVVQGFMAVLGTRSVRRASEAVRLLEDHLRVAPDDPVRSLRLGNLHRQLGNADAAEARWRKVQELAPDDLGTAISLAHLSWKRDGIDTTVGALEHALSLIHRLDDWASSPLRLDTTPRQLVALLVDVLGGLTDAVDHLTLLLAWTPRPLGKEARRKEVVLTMSELYLPYLERWDRFEEFLLTHSFAGARLSFERPEELSQLQRLLDAEPPRGAGWVSSSKKRNRPKRR